MVIEVEVIVVIRAFVEVMVIMMIVLMMMMMVMIKIMMMTTMIMVLMTITSQQPMQQTVIKYVLFPFVPFFYGFFLRTPCHHTFCRLCAVYIQCVPSRVTNNLSVRLSLPSSGKQFALCFWVFQA